MSILYVLHNTHRGKLGFLFDLRGCVDGYMRSIYICSRALYTWLYHIGSRY